MSRATEALAWLDAHAAEGAAYCETEILRMLVTQNGPASGGLFAEAYRRDLTRRVIKAEGRAEARALAHYIMFASNFGRQVLTLSPDYAINLDALAVSQQADTDTLGEILIAAHCIGHQSLAMTTAKALFDGAWAATPQVFENYHLILVGGIFYALASG